MLRSRVASGQRGCPDGLNRSAPVGRRVWFSARASLLLVSPISVCAISLVFCEKSGASLHACCGLLRHYIDRPVDGANRILLISTNLIDIVML